MRLPTGTRIRDGVPLRSHWNTCHREPLGSMNTGGLRTPWPAPGNGGRPGAGSSLPALPATNGEVNRESRPTCAKACPACCGARHGQARLGLVQGRMSLGPAGLVAKERDLGRSPALVRRPRSVSAAARTQADRPSLPLPAVDPQTPGATGRAPRRPRPRARREPRAAPEP